MSLFIGNAPWITVSVTCGDTTQQETCLLDTGFSGDLQVTPRIANELNLEADNIIWAQIANNDIIKVPAAPATVSLEGVSNAVNVLISESTPLAGISLLTKFGYKAIINCKRKTVILEIPDYFGQGHAAKFK